jgi:hypothetical protein
MEQIGLRAWRRAAVSPSADDHSREDAFLDQYIESGALVHQVAAEALFAALKNETGSNTQELLALRVFSEYVASLEVLGGWGWAIRNRLQAPLLLDAFLSYEVADVKNFYSIVSCHTGELSSLLALPPTQDITDEFRRREVLHADLLSDFTNLETRLSEASVHYFDPQEVFVTTYNKAKHGAPIFHEADLLPGDFLVIAPERRPGAANRYQFYKFGSEPHTVATTLNLIQWASHSIQGLVSFARNLKIAGLLY